MVSFSQENLRDLENLGNPTNYIAVGKTSRPASDDHYWRDTWTNGKQTENTWL